MMPTWLSTVLQRDVPGFTRAAVPILVDQGVKAVTLGVNGGSAPPDVPHNTPFLWHDKQSGTEIIAMWHPGMLFSSTFAFCA